MTEKIPPVLSVDRIGEIVGDCKQWWEIPAKVSVAQRDADVAYYEPLIQQAKEEVARKIQSIIDKEFDTSYKPHIGQSAVYTINLIRQSLKDKYLKREL